MDRTIIKTTKVVGTIEVVADVRLAGTTRPVPPGWGAFCAMAGRPIFAESAHAAPMIAILAILFVKWFLVL
jgi:hypothetical protein